jgi:hypothetical protein
MRQVRFSAMLYGAARDVARLDQEARITLSEYKNSETLVADAWATRAFERGLGSKTRERQRT